MPTVKWDQLNFSRGQLDPKVQYRTDWPHYYRAAKKISNCICIPQGGVTRRWGTKGIDVCNTVAEDYKYVQISTVSYNEDLTYLLLWEGKTLTIYLEDFITAKITTIYQKEDITNLRFCQVENYLVITDGNHTPQLLSREDFKSTQLTYLFPNSYTFQTTIPTPTVDEPHRFYKVGTVLPVKFTKPAVGEIPVTVPQIYIDRPYYIRVLNNAGASDPITGVAIPQVIQFSIHESCDDAVKNIRPFYIPVQPNPANINIIIQSKWLIKNFNFINQPVYDFNANYLNPKIKFTPDRQYSTDTTMVTVNASWDGAAPNPNPFTGTLNGLFSGAGGVMRIKEVNLPNQIKGTTITPFQAKPGARPDSTDAAVITGDLAHISQPAWSNERGWPRYATYYQNRLVFASTASIPNGQWLSVINQAKNFDDSTDKADSAISSYPSSGGGGVIQSVTSARSLLVHTNKANYSTSVQNEAVITPTTYFVIEHNKFGVSKVSPVYIDNQLFFIDSSGNNMITMVWDYMQGNYITNSVSIAASSLIKKPVAMAAFSEPKFMDGFYVLLVNSVDDQGNGGDACILQTLKEENILAFSTISSKTYLIAGQNKQYLEKNAIFRNVASSQNRCWMLVEKTVLSPISMPSFRFETASTNENAFYVLNNSLELNTVYWIILKPTSDAFVLPTTIPILTQNFYFMRKIANDKVAVYGSYNDAANDVNRYVPYNVGKNYNIKIYTNVQRLIIEEVGFEFYTDMSTSRINVEDSVDISSYLNGYMDGQIVQVVSDGHVLEERVVYDNVIKIPERNSKVLKIGSKYVSSLVPLTPVIPETPGMLFNPTHLRTIYIAYYNTVGATVQGFGIPVQPLNQVVLGEEPTTEQASGVFTCAPMEGWSGAVSPDLEITQEKPLPMIITGLSYVMDI